MTYPIRVVARETGLSVHVIRVWEKRYQAVVPERTKTQRRLYTEEDLRKLKLLRQLTAVGHPIGTIAQLPEDALQRLLRPSEVDGSRVLDEMPRGPNAQLNSPALAECLAAIRAFDTERLRVTLENAAIGSGYNVVLRHLIAPLIEQIGDLWSAGELRMSHEHFATAVIRNFLLNPVRQYAGTDPKLRLVATTPQGQLHELGAVMATALAIEQGWHSVYLGPSLPAGEIAGVALQHAARAVLLSLIYPLGDPNVEHELEDLRRFLPKSVFILVGGRAAAHYRAAIESSGGLLIQNLEHLQVELERISATEPEE